MIAIPQQAESLSEQIKRLVKEQAELVAKATTEAFEIDNWEVLMLRLGVGLLLSLILRWHFQMFGSTFSNRREFSRNFPLILMTTILIISIVKSSLALSFGLIGALSIVRFRTPIKEPEELGYLYLTIGIGLGLGAGLVVATAATAGIIMLAMAGVHWEKRDDGGRSVFLSIEWEYPDGAERPLDTIAKTIGSFASGNDLRRVDKQGGRLDATFYVSFDGMSDLSDLLAKFDTECPGASVTVIDQNRMPTV